MYHSAIGLRVIKKYLSGRHDRPGPSGRLSVHLLYRPVARLCSYYTDRSPLCVIIPTGRLSVNLLYRPVASLYIPAGERIDVCGAVESAAEAAAAVKAHRLVYHSTLGLRVIKKKKRQLPGLGSSSLLSLQVLEGP